jgi:integrase
LHRFLGELPSDTTAYALFYTAAFTGARRGELLGLRWEDLSVDPQLSGKLRIELSIVPSKGKSSEMTTPKTATSIRTTAISHDVVRVLQRHRDRVIERSEEIGDIWVDTNAIFPSEAGTYLSPHNASRLFRYWVAKTKAPRLSRHGLRHTHASLLIARGHSPKAVSERLGHTGVKFTIDRYQHLYDRQRRPIAIGIDDLIGAPMPPEESVTAPGTETLASIDG